LDHAHDRLAFTGVPCSRQNSPSETHINHNRRTNVYPNFINASASVTVRNYAHTIDGNVSAANVFVWLELAPQHPKLTGAIWADLICGTRRYLQLQDDERGMGKAAFGFGHAYLLQAQGAPHLAVGQNA
jgi:hypothetical protein